MIVAEVVTMLIYITSMWLLPTYFGKGQQAKQFAVTHSHIFFFFFRKILCRHNVYLDSKVCHKVCSDHRHQ
jgi:hypothetical protein